MLTGVPVIAGSSWCVHVLNALAANAANSHPFSFGMFSSIGSNGNSCGRSGVVARERHGQVSSVVGVAAWHSLERCFSGCGNESLMIFRSFSAVWGKVESMQLVDMCTIWWVVLPCNSIRNKREPTILSGECVIPTIRCLVGTRYDVGHPDLVEEICTCRASLTAAIGYSFDGVGGPVVVFPISYRSVHERNVRR